MTGIRNAMVVTFDTLDEANAAVEALVSEGLPRDALEVRALEDEAGAVAGDFLVGNGDTGNGRQEGPERGSGELGYDDNFRHVSFVGTQLLTLSGLDEAQLAQARAIVARFHGVLPGERVPTG